MESEIRVEAPFGEWLMRKLREREMSLSDVARLAQCDYTYLWRLVNVGRARGRQYRRPSYDMAERVGRALGATHEALTAAGYLPAENVQNSRVVDALDRVERQLAGLRAELSRYGEAGSAGDGQSAATVSGDQPAVHQTPAPGTAAGWRVLPLLNGDLWPEDPDLALDRIELPAWLALDADWAVRVPEGAVSAELRPGDLALIRRGAPRSGQLAVVARRGKLDFSTDASGEAALGSIVAIVRRMPAEERGNPWAVDEPAS